MANGSSASALPWPAIVLLIAGISGSILGVQYELRSSRPEGSNAEGLPSATSQTRQAFLWQDPFSAVPAIADANTDQANISEGGTQIGDVLKWTGAVSEWESTLIMPVMITGAGYGVERERRRRSRYAVVSALFSQNYFPVDPQHIGFFDADVNATEADMLTSGGSVSSRPFRIPYEEFQHTRSDADRTNHRRRAIILWLPDEMFSTSPLLTLERLFVKMKMGAFTEIEREPTANGISGFEKEPELEVRILGPGGSGTLELMVREIKNSHESISYQNWKQCATQMISPWSTVDPEFLGATEELNAIFKHVGIDFFRSVKTDSQVCSGLLNELQLRNLTPDPFRAGTIVLLSEWDTNYGRSLPRSFRNEIEGTSFDEFKIEVRRYLREIDGIGFEAGATNTDTSKKNGNGNEISREQMRKAVGTGQYDYVRRLADELKALDQRERSRVDGNPIRAVGVLGSDVYDKLLLLQATRAHLPDTVFFTTDLDGALTHPTETTWARNLIVGSSYGLTLDDDYQEPTLPFRSSYQTSLFASALTALGRIPPTALPGEDHDPRNNEIPVRIFELGGFKTIDLSQESATAIGSSILPEPERIYHLKGMNYMIQAAFLLLPFMVMAVPVYLMIRYGFRQLSMMRRTNGKEHETYESWWRVFTAATWTCFVLFMLAVLWAALAPGDHEPLEIVILNGTSSWLSEGLRLVAAFLSIWLFVWSMIRLSVNERELSVEFGLEDVYRSVRVDMTLDKERKAQEKAASADLTEGSKLGWLRSQSHATNQYLRRLIRFMMFEPRNPVCDRDHPRMGSVGKADRIWRFYLYNTDLIRHGFHWCAWSWAVFYLVGGTVLIWMWHWPYAPVRGGLAQAVDLVSLVISQITILGLIYLVAWAARRCSGLTTCLAARLTEWPAKVYSEKFGLKDAASYGSEDAHRAMSEWLTIEFISRRTAIVGNMIISPFLVVAVQILARNRLFDAWTWPSPLIFVYVCTTLIAVYFAIGLRRAAEKARRNIVMRLDEIQTELKCKAIKAGNEGTPGFSNELKNLVDWVRKEIESNTRGAFSPISKNPILVAVLLPFGGVGSLAFIEWAVKLTN